MAVDRFYSSDKNFTNRKFSSSLDKVVDTQKLDFALVKDTLRTHLKDKQIVPLELTFDLIITHLQSERFPDPRVLQCELDDIGFLSPERSRKLVKYLWDFIYQQQSKRYVYENERIYNSNY